MSEFSFLPFDGTFEDRLSKSYFSKTRGGFSKVIAATDEHFWNPDDRRYIDFSLEFDLKNHAIMPFDTVPELCCDLRDELTPDQQIEFANDSLHWWLSGFLYGEQGALSLSLSLCEILGNPDAVENASNQAREEARHVNAFNKYIGTRWGCPMEVSPAFRDLLSEIVTSRSIHRKIVGMQLLVEGLAMGFMASLYNKASDPVLVRLAQLVMTDEAFHHKAGQMWALQDFKKLSLADREDAEDWAVDCFQSLMFEVFNPSQKIALYQKYGWDADYARKKIRKYYTEDVRRQELSEQSGVFRILAKTLIRSGIVSKRTRHIYSQWLDLDSLNSDDTNSVETFIAKKGMEFISSVK